MFKKTQTVDSILSSFNTMAADLKALIESKEKERDDIQIKIKELADEHVAISTEHTRAQIALDKINNFLGG